MKLVLQDDARIPTPKSATPKKLTPLPMKVVDSSTYRSVENIPIA